MESFSSVADEFLEDQVFGNDHDYSSFHNDVQPVNTVSQSQPFSKGNSDAAAGVSRIPKRPRLIGEQDIQIIDSSAALLSLPVSGQNNGCLSASVTRQQQETELLPHSKIPPWQQQQQFKETQPQPQPPWKDQIDNCFVNSEYQQITTAPRDLLNNDGGVRTDYAPQPVIDPYSQLHQQAATIIVQQQQPQQTAALFATSTAKNTPPWQRFNEPIKSCNEKNMGDNTSKIFNSSFYNLGQTLDNGNDSSTKPNNGKLSSFCLPVSEKFIHCNRCC